MDSASLNIIYLPDETTRKKAIEICQKVSSKLPVEFNLGQGTIPHITIYQARFPNKNVGKLKEIIREIASQTRPFEIEMGPFFINVVRGFVWWNCIKSDVLTKIHWETIEKANALREGLIPDIFKNYKGTKEEETELKTYGAFLMGKRYPPHITITRLKDPQDEQKAFGILGKEEYSTFDVDKIALGLLGAHGTVAEIIEESPLLF